MRKISGLKNLVFCPKCHRQFSPIYARMTACGGCPSVTMGNCGQIKCPYCGQEFPYGSQIFH
ncbi:MAG: hypothetical protein ACTSRG_10685 [Candidatus Helarchaeota archaeon]